MFSHFRSWLAGLLSNFSRPIQIVALAATCLILAVLLFWIFNQTIYYFLAKSYVEEVADAFDLNRHLAQAIVWLSFAAIAFLMARTFSLNRNSQRIGYIGLLSLLVGHSLILWHGTRDSNFTKDGKAARCYVLTRDTIKLSNRTGIDPETGRECRPVTPQMAEKIRLYQKGMRPTALTVSEPDFFDPLSGEPIVWYAKSVSGAIEIFDLMGFHPRTGEELAPVSRPIVETWRAQSEKTIRRAAARIENPSQYMFFDPTNGSPRAWYFKTDNGDFEFFDGPGFHPRTGEALSVVGRNVLTEWRQTIEAATLKKKQDDEERLRLNRERADREAQERIERQQAEQAQRQKEAEAARQLAESADSCDRLAANPTDARRTADGTPFEMLRTQADAAIDACTKASIQFPQELRYQYQLARALQFKDRKRSFEIFSNLVKERYPAAFDNLGWMYWSDRNDKAAAIEFFKTGVRFNDPDSMVSLATLIERGDFPTADSLNAKMALYRRAAELGHKNAERAFQIEAERLNKAQIDYANQQQTNQQMLNIIGGVLGAAVRR